MTDDADGRDPHAVAPDGDATGARVDVRDTFERIADHFAETRARPWPEVESFLADRRGQTALDLGCGNGRHAELLADRAARVVGVDVSARLLAIAVERARDRGYDGDFHPVRGDATALPLRADSTDLALYVAALHHLSVGDARRSLADLARVLAPGGEALVSVWSTAHDRFDRTAGFDTTVDWTLPGGETVPRYYHVYAPDEFRALLEASPLALRTFQVSSGNCYATVAVERKRT
ncbi:MAG: class I SAM-dependent methyltransferase [Halobacteriaceae archaeon]